MDKSSNTTSEYEARAEAYRAKAQDIQNWIDCNEADEDEVARAIEARDAYEAAAEAVRHGHAGLLARADLAQALLSAPFGADRRWAAALEAGLVSGAPPGRRDQTGTSRAGVDWALAKAAGDSVRAAAAGERAEALALEAMGGTPRW